MRQEQKILQCPHEHTGIGKVFQNSWTCCKIIKFNLCWAGSSNGCFLLQANMANLESSITVHGFKLELKLFGFNEKLPVLVRRIMEFHQSLVVTPESFQVCKNELSTNSLQRPFFLVVFCWILVTKELDSRDFLKYLFLLVKYFLQNYGCILRDEMHSICMLFCCTFFLKVKCSAFY